MKKLLAILPIVAYLILNLAACSTPKEKEDLQSAGIQTGDSKNSNPDTIPGTPYVPEQLDQAPDYVFFGGDIVTMNPDQPHAQAIAVQGNLIQALGSDADMVALAGEDTALINLDGYTLMPGFIDSHSHRITQRNKWGNWTIGQAAQEAVSQGWSGLDELYVNEEQVQEIIAADKNGEINTRLNIYLAYNGFAGEDLGEFYNQYTPGEYISPLVRIAGIKIFIDYDSGRSFFFNQDELTRLLNELHAEGWQVSMKAVSIQSHELALGAIGQVIGDQSNDPYRYRLEHSIAVTNEQLDWMADKGIITAIQPGFPGVLANDPDITRMAEENGFENSYRWSDYQQTGVIMVGSPLNPPGNIAEHFDASHMSPAGVLYRGVTQIGPGSLIPEPWMLEKTLTVEEMLPILTINGAYTTFEEDLKGSLAPGKWADLVIFSGNLLETETDDLPEITALMTMVDGQVRFCKEGFENLCVASAREQQGGLLEDDSSTDAVTDGRVVLSAGQTIKIGVQGPVSGPLSALYTAMENAVRLSVEDFGGSLDEYRIEILAVDDQCDQGGAQTAAAQLVREMPEIAGVIGPMCSSGVLGALPTYQALNLSVISGSANRDELAEMFGDGGFNSTIPLAGQFAEKNLEEDYIDTMPQVVAFFERYEAQFGMVPADAKPFLPYIYDATQLLLKAMGQSAARDSNNNLVISRSALMAAIRSIQFEGITGVVSLDESGRRLLAP